VSVFPTADSPAGGFWGQEDDMFVDITAIGDKVDWLLPPNLPRRRWMFQGGLQDLLAAGIMVAGRAKSTL